MRVFLWLTLLSACLIFTSLSFAANQENQHFITVTECDYSTEEIFNLIAAAEQKVLFTTQQNWEQACAQQYQVPSEQSTPQTNLESNQ